MIENVTAVVDYAGMVRTAVARLVGAGRRRIAMLGHFRHDDPVVGVFEHSLADHGLPVRGEWIHGQDDWTGAEARWNAFVKVWTAREDKPDGLVVTDDAVFDEVAKAILAAGVRVGDELMIAIHSNKGSGLHYPFPVIRLEFDPEDFARAHGERMLQLVRGKPAPDEPVVVPFMCIDALPMAETHLGRMAQNGLTPG